MGWLKKVVQKANPVNVVKSTVKLANPKVAADRARDVIKEAPKAVLKRQPEWMQRLAMKSPLNSYALFLSEQMDCKDTACRRAALRRHHIRSAGAIAPWNWKTERMESERINLTYGPGATPESIDKGLELQGKIDARTYKTGVIGATVGLSVLGLSSLAKGLNIGAFPNQGGGGVVSAPVAAGVAAGGPSISLAAPITRQEQTAQTQDSTPLMAAGVLMVGVMMFALMR